MRPPLKKMFLIDWQFGIVKNQLGDSIAESLNSEKYQRRFLPIGGLIAVLPFSFGWKSYHNPKGARRVSGRTSLSISGPILSHQCENHRGNPIVFTISGLMLKN